MTDQPVNLSSGLPETVLPDAPAEATSALTAALAAPEADRPVALAAVAAGWPRFLDAWARLGQAAQGEVEAYAYFRVGYHRGLDQLRQAGWRGSGYVRWQRPANRGFLRCLVGLAGAAAAIGEDDEAERCHTFRRQLDPSWDGAVD